MDGRGRLCSIVSSPRLRLTLQLSSLPMPAAVIVTDLVKQFGRFAALRGVNAEFASGRLYAILGDNGAGKTTLLARSGGVDAADAWQHFDAWEQPIFVPYAAKLDTWPTLLCFTTK